MRRVLPLSWMTLLVMPMAASAFHGGAPTCHADDILESPMGNPISNMGYTLVATPAQYTPGVAMTLSRLVQGLCERNHHVQLVRPRQASPR